MGRASEPARTVKVEIPAEAFQHRPWDPTEVAQEMRVLWLLEEVRARRLGYGKAAELAGVPTAEFLRLMGRHQITPFDYDDDELARELRA
jgi:predicted HTH domain antitoxin